MEPKIASLTDWLLTQGGPVIRYRTATELVTHLPPREIDALQRDLVYSPLVRRWLDRLEYVVAIHDRGNDRFENVVGKLLEFGVKAGIPRFDQAMLPFRHYLNPERKAQGAMTYTLNGVIVAWGLLRVGYRDIPELDTFMQHRLDQLDTGVRTGSYAIYADPEEAAQLPKAFRNKYGLVRATYTANGEFLLPYIHDLYALAVYQHYAPKAEIALKIEAILRYVLTTAYQELPQGYGCVKEIKNRKARYYTIGWKVDLPGFFRIDPHARQMSYFVQRLELLAHFPRAVQHEWFQRGLAHLEEFRTPQGTYCFPRHYLQEKSVGYWVNGAHMGLEENRRSQTAIELESTFRMLKIQKLMATSGKTKS